MSGPFHSLFVSGSVIIAILLVLAAPATAMKMKQDTSACGTSVFSHPAGNSALSQEPTDCQNNCYRLCALTCTDGWCMIGCMRNCDRYCGE